MRKSPALPLKGENSVLIAYIVTCLLMIVFAWEGGEREAERGAVFP